MKKDEELRMMQLHLQRYTPSLIARPSRKIAETSASAAMWLCSMLHAIAWTLEAP
jgi:hypothetical protein